MTTTHLEPTAEAWRRNLGRTPDARLAGDRGSWWWTGLAPAACPGWDPQAGCLRSLPQLDLARATREAVLAYFENGWCLTEQLFASLACEEAFYRPPTHRLRHPMVFYFGHPASVFVNKLRVAGFLGAAVDAGLERLFETGVDEMSWDDMAKNDEAWPTVEEVLAYRRKVHGVVRELLASHPALRPGATRADGSLLWAVAMGCEHERIHLETSSVLIRELPLELVQRPSGWVPPHPSVPAASPPAPTPGHDHPENPLQPMPAATVRLGKPADFPSFGWDNEYGADERHVEAFEATSHLVSNGEYHAFVAAGGYREPRWWTEAGWAWRAFRNVKWPTWWVPDGPAGSHRFRLRLPFEEVPMPWAWPVEVNAHEARAFAAWRSEREGRGLRLPTEAEHVAMRPATDRAASPARPELDPVLRAGSAAMAETGRNLNLAWGSPWPVDTGLRTEEGLVGVTGNVWTWCEDDFHPLPGSQPDPLYDDFSAPCYDGEHTMILGGSFLSTGHEASVWARFHFRPHFHQSAGIRLIAAERCDAVRVAGRGAAQRAATTQDGGAVYETRRLVDEYMLMHHGAPEDVMPWSFGPRDGLDFAGRCGHLVLAACQAHGVPLDRALDLGCAVGGASFVLATAFREVVGADWSQAFVDAAEALRREGRARYFLRHEGELGEEREVHLPEGLDRARLRFERADAHHPPATWGRFNAVLIANLVDRLHAPRTCLRALEELVAPGGLLVVTTPYTWLPDFTPREAWLGGRSREDRPGAEGLAEALTPAFTRLEAHDMPFVIREHGRKFQWSVAQATVWRRR
ncbi:MAG: 5-histidylcysteine sulfoxide synthase [Candidatus Sericytochromatia bacterium]|nr:5-histidylcysteine sulfoxide synthase [Candidatus Sericytochromatia bacterium]